MFLKGKNSNILKLLIIVSITLLNPLPARALEKGDTVKTIDNIKVRSCPHLACPPADPYKTAVLRETTGVLQEGPYFEDGYAWWRVRWENGLSGYSVQNWMTILSLLAKGDTVKAIKNVRVRDCPYLFCAPVDSKNPSMPESGIGEISAGPFFEDGYTWWYVKWENGLAGFSAQEWLKAVLKSYEKEEQNKFALQKFGSITIDAILDGKLWAGLLEFRISGADEINGMFLPGEFPARNTGKYTFTYIAGGPEGADLFDIIKSDTQMLFENKNISFRLVFVSRPPVLPPIVVSGIDKPTGLSSSLITGIVKPNGADTESWFEAGTTISYSSVSKPVTLGKERSTAKVSEEIANLKPNITYHYRVVASNVAGISFGEDRSFTMPPLAEKPPEVYYDTPAYMGPHFVVLEGKINANCIACEAWFEWGSTSDYEYGTERKYYTGTGANAIPVNGVISNLKVGGLYNFRIVSRNSAGTSYGKNRTFIYGGSTVFGYSQPSDYLMVIGKTVGHYAFKEKDIEVPGRGGGLAFERNYSSNRPRQGPLGFGWNHNFNIFLRMISFEGKSCALLYWPDGKIDAWISDGAKGYHSQNGFFGIFTDNDDETYTLKKKDMTSYIFDNLGQLSSIVDRNGNAISLTYSKGDLRQITDAAGRRYDLTYNKERKIEFIIDPLERGVHYSYDANGDLVFVSDEEGHKTFYQYNSGHQITKIIDPGGNHKITNTYDSLKRLDSSQDAIYGITIYAYDTSIREIRAIDNIGNAINFYYDDLLRPIVEADENGNYLFYEYDSTGNKTEIKDRKGNVTNYTYDKRGNLLTEKDPLGNSLIFEYDINNNIVSKTDKRGYMTLFEYDDHGNQTKITDSVGGVKSMKFDEYGQLVSVTDWNGNVTLNQYDEDGNLFQVTDAMGNSMSYSFDRAGRMLASVNQAGEETTYLYDDNNSLLARIDPLGSETHYAYDANKNLITVIDPIKNQTTYAYDEKNRLLRVMDALGGKLEYVYDLYDRKISETDKKGNVMSYEYDEVGNLVRFSDNLGQEISYMHDANGNKMSETNLAGKKTYYMYDFLNRVVSIKDRFVKGMTFTYDASGNITLRKDVERVTLRLEYDPLGRVIKRVETDGDEIFYTYDGNGNLLTQKESNGFFAAYKYDALNRMTGESNTFGSWEYGYDKKGNLITLTNLESESLSNEYDANDRLISIQNSNGKKGVIDYDLKGNNVRVEDELGISSYRYDALGQTSEIEYFMIR